jgi:hypothetical protein
MDVEIAVVDSNDPQGELVALLQWLNQADEYRGQVEFTPAEIREHELGAAHELLLAVIAAGGLDALGQTIGVWLQTRRSEIEVTVTAKDGGTLHVSAKGAIAKSVAKKLGASD